MSIEFCILVILPCLSFTSSSGLISNSTGGTCLLQSDFGSAGAINSSCSSCKGVYVACRQLLVDGLRSPSNGESSDANVTVEPPSKAEAYGYGFLLSIAVSGTSLFALLLVPCLKPGAKLFFLYKPINALMMGSASSALLADAVLHILPEIYGNEVDTQSTTVDPHLHLWRACLLLAAVYAFFVLEFFLHAMRSKSISSHGHSHSHAGSSDHQSQSRANGTGNPAPLSPPQPDEESSQKVENEVGEH